MWYPGRSPDEPRHAIASPVLRVGTDGSTRCLVAVVRGDSKVAGTITFEQASESAPTTVSWDLTGHDANAKRGMHIHTFGDNTNGCTSAGPHCASLPTRRR